MDAPSAATFLLPPADGIADEVARRYPQAAVIRYGDDDYGLDAVSFYCLPYLGEAGGTTVLSRLPRLRVLQSLSSGVDGVLDAVPSGVTLCNGLGLHHEEGAAELAVTLILASLRLIPAFVLAQSQRSWQHCRTDSLDGKRVLLVGYGTIGTEIEKRLLPFGAAVARVSRTPRQGVAPLAELPRLAAAADILVCCIALTPQTRGLISGDVLAALPAGSLVVNVGRGPLVDAAALRAELAGGRLQAALDVADLEPLPAGRPEWALPNVLITPHVGGDTLVFGRRAAGFVADQAGRHLSGRPLANVVRRASP